jgi:hypothetical protein
MPKAAMNEYSGSVFCEHQVWLSRQILAINPESKSAGVDDATDNPFRSGVT